MTLRHIRGEDVIEGAVFPDQDDDVFDGSTRVWFLLSL